MDINEKMNKIALELSEEYDIVYMGLYGSQNYNLDTEESDIDVKCFVMPNFSNIYERTMISKEVPTSYGIADVKDIRLLPELIGKCGLTYLEAFITDYYVVGNNQAAITLIQELRRMVNIFINDHSHLLAMVIKQVANNKIKEVIKNPSKKKELAHIRRLELVLQKLDADLNFKEALFLTDNEREDILAIKKVLMPELALNFYLSNNKIDTYYKSLAATIAPINRMDVTEYLDKEIYRTVAGSLYADLKDTFEN